MPYNSPFQTLGLDVSSEINRSTLNLARRKMFAEIDLSPNQTITRGEKELTKDDVIRLFDSLDKAQDLEFHRLIAKDESLLYFLETKSIKRERKSKKHKYILQTFADEPMYHDPDFKAFISPYYAESWAKVVLGCLEKQEPSTLKDVLDKLPMLMTHEAETDVWTKVESFLQTKITLLREFVVGAENGNYYEITTLHEATHGNLMRCINLLPSSFWSIREVFAVQTHNLAVVYLNKGNTTYANYALNQALTLDCSAEAKGNLAELQRVMSVIYERETQVTQQYQSTSNTESNGEFPIQAIIGIVILLIKIGMCASR